MLVTLFVALMGAQVQSEPKIVCPVRGEPIDSKGKHVEFGSNKYWFCHSNCSSLFKKDPARYVKAAKVSGKTVGVCLFDPVSHERVEVSMAKGGTTDFEGVRYPFTSEDNKLVFKRSPSKFARVPSRESLFCVVSGEKAVTPGKAASYVDFKDVRYFVCCVGCDDTFLKSREENALKSRDFVVSLGVFEPQTESIDQVPIKDLNVKCTHCGKDMKIKDESDGDSRCTVCGCGVGKRFCIPDGK